MYIKRPDPFWSPKLVLGGLWTMRRRDACCLDSSVCNGLGNHHEGHSFRVCRVSP